MPSRDTAAAQNHRLGFERFRFIFCRNHRRQRADQKRFLCHRSDVASTLHPDCPAGYGHNGFHRFFLPCPHYTAAGIRQQKEKKKNRKKVLLTALSYGSVCSFFPCFLHHEPSAAAGIFLYGSLCKDARFYAESFPRLISPRGYS